jgi:hypothetical protein
MHGTQIHTGSDMKLIKEMVYFTTKKSVCHGANFTFCNSTLVSTLLLQLTQCIHLVSNERIGELERM